MSKASRRGLRVAAVVPAPTIRLRITADDDTLPDGAKAFQCPGCGAQHVAIPQPNSAYVPGQSLGFAFTCMAEGCSFGPDGVGPYSASMGVG